MAGRQAAPAFLVIRRLIAAGGEVLASAIIIGVFAGLVGLVVAQLLVASC